MKEDAVVFLEGITKSFNKTRVLDNLGFSVAKGEIFGFLGPNGAGKTTTLLILLGLLEPDTGKAFVCGRRFGDDAEVRRKAGVVLDTHGLYETMTLRENLRYFAGLYGVPDPGARADEAAELTGLRSRMDEKTGKLSRGLQQRSALARALLNRPQVLFLDEPAAGLDPEAQVDFRELLTDLNRRHGTTVFLNSHNLEEVQKICTKVAVLNRGRLLICDRLENLRAGGGGTEQDGCRYELAAADESDAAAAEALIRADPRTGRVLRKGRKIVCTAGEGEFPLKSIINAGIEIESYSRYTEKLEDIYLRIVRSSEDDRGGGER